MAVAVAGTSSQSVAPVPGTYETLVEYWTLAPASAVTIRSCDGSVAKPRVAESSMQIISLIGGWPGAIVAQQVLRHKTRKRGFLFVFWTAVVLNMAALAILTIILGGSAR